MCIFFNVVMIEHIVIQAKRNFLDKNIEPFGIRGKMFWDVKETRMVRLSYISWC